MSLILRKHEVEGMQEKELRDELYINSLDSKIDLSCDIINSIKKIAVKLTEKEANEALIQIERIRSRYEENMSKDYDYGVKFSKDNLIFWFENGLQDKSYYRGSLSDKTFFVRVKGQAKELLELLSERSYNHLIENRPYADYENELDAELEQCNTRRFIKANPYDTLGKSTYDYDKREVERIAFKTKEGEDVKISKGLLYQCFDCNSYAPLEEIDAILHFRLQEEYEYNHETKMYDAIGLHYSLRGAFLLTATCPKCKEVSDMKYVSYVGQALLKAGDISNSLFDDLEEKSKLTFSTISKRKSLFGDRCSTKTNNNRIVFNVKTGRSYLLPSYSMDKKKANNKRKLLQLGANSVYDASQNVTAPLKLIYKAGNLIEKYLVKNKLVNTKAIIPFKKYFEDAIRAEYRNFTPDEVLNLIKALQDDTLGSSKDFAERISNYTRIEILMCYNQNPYIEYKFYKSMIGVKHYRRNGVKFPTKVINVKRVRNTDLVKQVNKATGAVTKSEKDFVKSYKDTLDGYFRLIELKKVIKNKDNLNKVLKLEQNFAENPYRTLTSDITNNPYLNRLIQEFGETNVINAILKDDKVVNYEANHIYFRDTIHNYETIIKALPEYKLPSNRLRLRDLHDKIAKDAAKVKQAKRTYEYEEELINTFDNKHIDGVDFKVATSNHTLTEIGSIMHICVGGYSYSVEKGDNFIVSMQKGNEYIGCLEIRDNGVLCQAKARRNSKLNNDMQEALRKYCEMTNLTTDTWDLEKEYQTTKDDTKKSLFNGNPIKIKVVHEVNQNTASQSPVIELPPLNQEVLDDIVPF